MLHKGLSKDYILEQSWVAPIYLPPFLSSITFAAVSQSGPQALIQMVCNEPPPHPDMILCALMRSETRHLRTTRCLTATERTTHRSFGAVRNCGGAFPKLASEPPIILSCSRELPFFAFSDTCCATELSLLVIVVARKRRDCNKGSADDYAQASICGEDIISIYTERTLLNMRSSRCCGKAAGERAPCCWTLDSCRAP